MNNIGIMIVENERNCVKIRKLREKSIFDGGRGDDVSPKCM